MTRDYKKPTRQNTRKSGGSSMLTGLVVGLFVGLAVAIGIAAYIYLSPNPFTSRVKPDQPAPVAAPPGGAQTTQPAGTQDATGKAADKPRFDFYTILPGSDEAANKEMKQAAKPAESTPRETYFLQAGAFQSENEADNLKAKLALLGVEAVIQTANLPDKGSWHRVRIGPYSNIDDLNRTRSLLAQNGINASLVKIRDGASD
jgi:cell division protein FtsN